jgi:hypothetical protein
MVWAYRGGCRSQLHGRRSHRRIETVPRARVGNIPRKEIMRRYYLVPNDFFTPLLSDVDAHIRDYI